MIETLRGLVSQGALVLDGPPSSSISSSSNTTAMATATAATATTGGAASSSTTSSETATSNGEVDWAHEYECIDAVRRLCHHAGEGRALLRPCLREVAAFLVRAVQVCVCR